MFVAYGVPKAFEVEGLLFTIHRNFWGNKMRFNANLQWWQLKTGFWNSEYEISNNQGREVFIGQLVTKVSGEVSFVIRNKGRDIMRHMIKIQYSSQYDPLIYTEYEVSEYSNRLACISMSILYTYLSASDGNALIVA